MADKKAGQCVVAIPQKNYGKDFDYKDLLPCSEPSCSIPTNGPIFSPDPGRSTLCRHRSTTKVFACGPTRRRTARGAVPGTPRWSDPSGTCWASLATRCANAGMKYGFYYSLYEWFNPLWLKDRAAYVTQHMHPAVQGRGEHVQAGDHFQRRRVGHAFEGLEKRGTAGLVIQRVALQRRGGNQRSLGQGDAATNTAAITPPSTGRD